MRYGILFLATIFFTSPVFPAASTDITPGVAYRLAELEQAYLLDVRELAEVRETGIAEFAQWLAKSEIDARSDDYREFVAGLDRDRAVILYCRSGRRAEALLSHFEELGFLAFNMGSLRDWIAVGLPVVEFPE